MSGVVAGRYRLDNVIGSGGMGTVWRGYDEMLHRPVAVKELHLPAQLGPEARAEAITRAFTEARHAARLQHPGVVSVFDIVEHDGRPWIIMQLVEGSSLFQLVRQHGPMPPAEAARIGLAVLDALTAAHAAGIVHRDVKPSNVLLGPRGEVLLTDFSIAFAVGTVTMTNTGVVLGSPGYVAPERVSGGKAGPPTDLFGLGAMLFFLVEGVGPFDNEDPLAGLLASATRPHPRPRNAGPLTPVIDGLLVKDPAMRMPAHTAAEALAAIAGRAPGAPGLRPAAGTVRAAGGPVAWPTGGSGRPVDAAEPGTGWTRPAPELSGTGRHRPAPELSGTGRTRPGNAAPAHAGPPGARRPTSPRRHGDSDETTWTRRPAFLIAAGALLVLLVGGGLFLALRPDPGASAAEPPPTTTPEATDLATPTAEPTAPPTTAPPTTTPATSNTPADNGVDDPPVIQSVTVTPSTVCNGRFTITVVAHDDSPELSTGYEYTITYPDGSGERWGGELTRGPNNTWTAEVGRPSDNGPFNRPGSTIVGYVSFYDSVNPPVQPPFPVTINVVNC